MALTENTVKEVMEAPNYVDRDVVAGAIEIFRGSILNADASGNVKLASDTAGELFAGVSMVYSSQDASALAGDKKVKVLSKGSNSAIKLKLTGVTKADIGKSVYAVDDEEVTLTAGNVLVGTVFDVSETTDYAFVLI